MNRRFRQSPAKSDNWLGKWWVQLLIAAWILAVVTIYFRLQLLRLIALHR